MPEKATRNDLEKTISDLEKRNLTLNKEKRFLQSSLEEQIRFEKLLSDLSATFINIPAPEVDREIESVLGRIGKLLAVDRISFFQLTDKSRQMRVTHSWAADGLEPQPHIITEDLFPWIIEKIRHDNSHIIYPTSDSPPKEAKQDRESLKKLGVKSGLLIPFLFEGSFICGISFGAIHRTRHWPENLIQRLRFFGETIFNALVRKQTDLELRNAFNEIQILKDRLQRENISLREEIETIKKPNQIIGQSKEIESVLEKVAQVADTGSTVLVNGETGTGKELVARAIHNLSSRKNRPMITVNCATLPATLVENELFGREKGAYTGATTKHIGRFEQANGSTIFLDEIGELTADLQVKLLRVLQQGQFERLGSSKTITVDVRVISATNRDLAQEIRNGSFREDLYYRLNVFPIYVPPLRERVDDIKTLAWNFIREFSEAMGKQIDEIERNSLTALQRHSWPGNVRELRNVIERAMIVNKSKTLTIEIPTATSSEIPQNLTLKESEYRQILRVLNNTNWRIRGKNGAAEILDLKPTTLYSKMKKLGIRRPEQPSNI